jgi:hypothetical protein
MATIKRRPITSTTTSSLADDVLIGTRAIADFIGIDERKCFHWLANKYIPASKTGNLWTSTRSALRRHFSGEARHD